MRAMPTCLITGCGGFIGSHLTEFLLSMRYRVVGTIHHGTRHISHLTDQIDIRKCDITDRTSLAALVREANPDFVFHLAAQDLIQTSWEDPEGTFRINVLGTLFLLEAIRDAGPHAVVQIAGSSAEYGQSIAEEFPISETRELRPGSPYAISKSTAVRLGLLFAERYGLRIHCIRPFQFIGPRKDHDACSDFARGIVDVERERSQELRVGNLDAIRDLLDIRDGVKAMWLVARSGQTGEVYNVSAGIGYGIRDVLERLISCSGVRVQICEDRARLRPLDEPIIVGDNAKLRGLGWEPETPLEDTLERILNYWREVTH
jgi:GDP-4-dehydro-6-deoxy-D-mannose reductase